ncbi:hypothetical protein GGTG_01298, partial [Gaeumannomyces tritici R3-111a-1]
MRTSTVVILALASSATALNLGLAPVANAILHPRQGNTGGGNAGNGTRNGGGSTGGGNAGNGTRNGGGGTGGGNAGNGTRNGG